MKHSGLGTSRETLVINYLPSRHEQPADYDKESLTPLDGIRNYGAQPPRKG